MRHCHYTVIADLIRNPYRVQSIIADNQFKHLIADDQRVSGNPYRVEFLFQQGIADQVRNDGLTAMTANGNDGLAAIAG